MINGVVVSIMNINKRAVFDLYLHGGKAPRWLISKMKKLGRAIIDVLLYEYNQKEVLARLSDPLWFQAFSYVLGYDWDSSGVTTVVMGVLKNILTPDTGLMVAGGKGNRALHTPKDIMKIGETFGFSEKKIFDLIRVSKLVAKIDNALVQDNHQLYHHTIVIDKNGNWTVVQQGMNIKLKTARRYHWVSFNVKSFVAEPHTGIIGHIKFPFVLNMASKDSLEGQRISLDLVNEGVDAIRRDLNYLIRESKKIPDLLCFLENNHKNNLRLNVNLNTIQIKILRSRINWQALNKAYELAPKSYEELILIKGIGPGTIRALALIAELIYHADISWKDPIRYVFAVGGKDGVPYPVNKRRMEETYEFLQKTIKEAQVGKEERVKMLRKLSEISIKLLPAIR